MTRKLGRTQSRRDARTLRLAKYLAPGFAHAAPPARDWTHQARAPEWGLFRNDEIGDCTIASRAHMIQVEAALTERVVTVLDSDVVEAYSKITGYDPGAPETDQGAQMIDVLKYMRTTGLAGRRVDAFAATDPMSKTQCEIAINAFGGLWAGVDLPVSAQDQTVWDVAPPGKHEAAYDRNSWGGHAVAVIGYQRTGLTCITWGAVKSMTWEFFMTYCSEAWVTIDGLWQRADGVSPSGFNAAALVSDLAAIVSA